MLRTCLVVVTLTIAASCGGSKEPPTAAAPVPAATAVPAPAASPAASATPATAADAYDQAAAFASAGQFDRAHAAFESASRAFPADQSIAAALAILIDRRGSRVSDDVAQRIFRAFDDANAGRWTEAHAGIDEAIKQAPGYPRAHSARGNVFVLQQKLDDAIAAFSGAIEADSQFWEGHFNRGSAYMSRSLQTRSREDAEAALVDLSRAHELAPTVVDPIFQRGVLLALAGEWPAALADLDKAIAIAPAFSDAYYNRGLAHQNLGDVSRAIADYSKAIELDPTDAPPLINRGLLLARQKNYDAALADLDRAAAVAPNVLNSRLEKAGVLESMGRRDEAIREWELVAEKGTGDAAWMGAEARQRLAALRQQQQ